MGLALYRKYRPQTFEDLVGQNAISKTLLNALKQNRLVHAYIFSGPRGTGKTSTARLLAKAIQCENRTEEGLPCSTCEVCVLNGKNELIDLVEVDAASNRGIEDIRDLREKIRLMPSRAKAKVYIIDEVHMLTKEAFNALLKSLEEPPAHIYFILATTEIHKIPETILSRCQRYDFRRITELIIVDHLENIAKLEKLDAERQALELLARAADGSLRDAISLFQQFSSEALTVQVVRERLGLEHQVACDDLYGAIGSADTLKGLEIIENIHREGFDLHQFTASFLSLLRHKLHEAVLADKNPVVPKILQWIELFDEAWLKLKKSSIAQLPLEIAVIRSTEQIVAAPAPVQVATQSTPTAPRAAVVSTPTPAPQPVKRPEGLQMGESIKKRLPEIVAAITNPSVRQSFQTGQLKSEEGLKFVFAYTSTFHFEKVNHLDSIVFIEEAFKKVLGTDAQVSHELDTPKAVPEMTEVESMGWEVQTETLS